jgi:hypothetical protein
MDCPLYGKGERLVVGHKSPSRIMHHASFMFFFLAFSVWLLQSPGEPSAYFCVPEVLHVRHVPESSFTSSLS